MSASNFFVFNDSRRRFFFSKPFPCHPCMYRRCFFRNHSYKHEPDVCKYTMAHMSLWDWVKFLGGTGFSMLVHVQNSCGFSPVKQPSSCLVVFVKNVAQCLTSRLLEFVEGYLFYSLYYFKSPIFTTLWGILFHLFQPPYRKSMTLTHAWRIIPVT